MNKEQIKQATLEDLLRKKTLKENNKSRFIDVEIKGIGATLRFNKPDEDIYAEALDTIGSEKKFSDIDQASIKLMYHTCPALRNTELHKELGVTDPYDAVRELFESNERVEIGSKIMALCNPEEISEQLKN